MKKIINIIPNSANVKFFNLPIREISDRKLDILFARRFVALRGVYLFIDLVKHIIDHPRVNNIKIVGDGPLENIIKNELENIPNVVFYRSDYNNIHNHIANSDIVLVPSMGSEGIPFIIVEALAAGKIVIASNVGGINNCIIDGFNGYLFNPTSADFISKFIAVLELPNMELNKIIENSRNVAIKSFSFELWKNNWLKIVNNVLAQN
jgi:glycosyltransferase involved in cell wall biosynthesis